MTETQYWILMGISIAGLVGYVICLSARKADETWAKHKDEHCTMVETKRNDNN